MDTAKILKKIHLYKSKNKLQKQVKYTNPYSNQIRSIRLNKYLASTGICSRRKADKYIQEGRIKINEQITTQIGVKINLSDQVRFYDKVIKSEKKVYILLNKPQNCITTTTDQFSRFTVLDIVKKKCFESVFPVGRLDKNTTGLILLTNDGTLSEKLIHPRHEIKKIYHVCLNREFLTSDMKTLSNGIFLDDGQIKVDNVRYFNEQNKLQILIEIHSGRNRIIRRIFNSLGYNVLQLDRICFAGLTKKRLKKGQWRFLKEKEVSILYKTSYTYNSLKNEKNKNY